jgi:hypothetical protein
MKDIFRGYYKLDDDEFKQLWKKAVFIFDTNVLLNLYRYQPVFTFDATTPAFKDSE